MKVEIIYPFVDFRRLDSNKNELLVRKPLWPKPQNSKLYYYRSMGQVYPPECYAQYDSNCSYSSSCIANGVRLNNAHIAGLKGINRVVDFIHNNDIFGFYSVSFFVKVGTFNGKTADDVYRYFKNVEFNIVDLVDHSQGLTMDQLKGYLCRQYYWATRLLAEKNDKSKKYYQRDSSTTIKGVEKIVMPNQKQEMRDIRFLEPYFILEYTFDDGIVDNLKKSILPLFKKDLLAYSKKDKLKMVTIKRQFYSMNDPDLRQSSAYVRYVRYLFLLFDFLGELSDYTPGNGDDRLDDYMNNIKNIYNEASEKVWFRAVKEFYEKQHPDFLENLNKNFLARIGANELSNLLSTISNTELNVG